MKNIYDCKVLSLNNSPVDLSAFQGKVLLIVNTASNCGFTPQYEALENIYMQYKGQGLEILAFPCNQFLQQEKGSNAEIGAFCTSKYDVTFPVFGKIDVNGGQAHPLFKYLKTEAPGLLGSKAIKWNFTKFLVARNGAVFKRYAPQTTPEKIASAIEQLL